MRAFIAGEAEAFGCEAEIDHISRIVEEGTSADRQIAIYAKAREAGRRRLTAIKDVIDWAGAETLAASAGQAKGLSPVP